MDYIDYITKEGERWDNIANKAYGDPGKMGPIFEANVGLPIVDRLAGGLLLRIPVIEATDVQTDKEKLPPWK